MMVKPAKMLKKLRKSKEGPYFVNAKEWEESLKQCFNTLSLLCFLGERFSMQVPKDQLWKCVFDDKMRSTIKSGEKELKEKKKELVKQEATEKGDSREQVDQLSTNQSEYELLVKRNVAEMVATCRRARCSKFSTPNSVHQSHDQGIREGEAPPPWY